MTSNRTPSGRSRWWRALAILTGLLLVGALVGGGGAAGAFYWVFLRDLPDPRGVADYHPPLATTVVDREGRPIGEFFSERRRLVGFDEMPSHVVQAFIAAEDSTFFEHEGIDYQGILRAAWVNLRAGGEIRQGGSTITQQMVKTLLLTPERSYTRKIREMILARRIEQRFTKQEILYLYLNQIYFGHGAHGIGEAARTYFDKSVEELTVSEAAQLAGLPKAPSRYSPYNDPEQAEERRRYVLGRMLAEEIIDDETFEEAAAHRPEFTDGSEDEDFEKAAYFTEEVRRFLFEVLGGKAVLAGGLRVETTLDLDLQRAATDAVRTGLRELDRRNGYRGPVRRVDAAAVEAEIARVAEENGLVAEEEEKEAEPEGDGAAVDAARAQAVADADPPPADADADADAGADADGGAEPPADVTVAIPEDFAFSREEPLLGVVTEVDREAELARVGFAPGLGGEVHLEDVEWARPLDPGTRPRPVERVDRVFRVGDVARFFPLDESLEAGSAERLAARTAPDGEDEAASAPVRLGIHQEPRVQGALLSLDVDTGDVLALVGGYDYDASQFNRTTQARRQPGSAFKPVIYGTALTLTDAEGNPLYTPASIVHDRPTVYVDERSGFVWKPQNYGREFYGPITLRTALAKSVNNAAVHLADQVGVDEVIDFARRLGIESPLERSLALALGTSGVSLLELTRAYAVFPAGGQKVVPRFLVRVLDRDGNVILEDVPLDADATEQEVTLAAADEKADADAAGPDADDASDADPDTDDVEPADEAADARILTPEQAYLMADMLRAVVNEGTGRRARVLGRPLAGKTGTTNDQADAWFVGFSPEVATGVWVGFDETRFLGAGETGSRAALPIWVDYMGAALEGRPRRDFDLPDSIVFARIDRETGLLASRSTREPVFQAFIEGTEPTEAASEARSDSRARQDLREDAFGGGSDDLMMQLDTF